ncbi:hypothetical protein [Parasulfuritortus cantonensis]|uniref:hypothetical protein n=1 Tax=Parasulfuritortus cantonensis TaxID=2528202 RepID=UPI00140536F5|nr:hypothetical protein [Parasulfuritortus cantonensis]
MMRPGLPSRSTRRQLPLKADRLLVGIVAGAALVYLAGKLLGLGKPGANGSKAE